ncbi:hypothetical protein SAMN05518801_105242 [Novosphingobium sp. CF614]|uniref:hypothetical protein n=1 Tax=Novosphingobium sp. CF614 TaxID=1884364 RepID=UPI0008EDA174|nr:hypothetical protein [Novosphingobium sp. CF614]SFG02149.1 hypothetical protein SAMN05518801_105242 [Novosphingobium sp. CF614]
MLNIKQNQIEGEDASDITSFGQDVAPAGVQFAGELSAFEVSTRTPLTRKAMYDLADPESGLVGVNFPTFALPGTCCAAMDVINAREAVEYKGPAEGTLSTGSGTSAWEARYPGIAPHEPDSAGSWGEYLDRVPDWDIDREALFASSFGGDPMESIINVLSTALGQPIERAVHPRFGRKMGMGLVRKGAPLAHFDFAQYDVGYNARGHIGIVLVLDAGPGAVQRAWNYQPEPDDDGNYDTFDYMLDPRLTGYIDVPTPVGCLSLLCARYIHEVKDIPDRRCTLAAHLAWLPDGDRWVIYA